MLRKMVVGGGIVALALAAAGMAGSAEAAHGGSMEDQLACTPDVYRLCSSDVPDEDAIVACLKRNVQALSPACHQVFTRPDTPAAPQGDGNGQDND